LSSCRHRSTSRPNATRHGAQIAWLAFQWAAAAGQNPWETFAFYSGEEHSRYLDGCRDALNLDVSRQVHDRRRRIGEENTVSGPAHQPDLDTRA
jgi:hypothetical protein